MSKNVRAKKGRTKRPSKKDATLDEDDDGKVVDGKAAVDPLLKQSEATVKKFLDFILKTQKEKGGLAEWFTKNCEKLEPENPAATAFNENKAKSRKEDIPCLDESRVKLKEVEAAKDFIHANYVKSGSGEKERSFICTQHPMDDKTIEDFWRMIFYENVDNIIAIYSADESLPQYFPTEVGKYATYGALFVNCRKVISPHIKFSPCLYQIEVLPDGCSNSKITNVIHYAHWGKGQIPVNPRVVMKTIRAVKQDKNNNAPIVVHCATGVNRACCMVMVDFVTHMTFLNNEVDLLALVKKIRNQRAQAFQNKTFFVYACLVYCAYIKIRCRRTKSWPDYTKEIDELISSLSKELASITAKEPPVKAKADTTADD